MNFRNASPSLGRLSAGLAHELNNPASAARRAAQNLREAVTRLRDANAGLCRRPLDNGQRAELAACESKWLQAAQTAAEADPLERSDREQTLGDWLEKQGVADGWAIAPELAEAGLSAGQLEEISSRFPAEALGDVVGRFSATSSSTIWKVRPLGVSTATMRPPAALPRVPELRLRSSRICFR